MSYPTVEEKLAALKVVPATEHELECIKLVSRGTYEIALQRTADILDEGYEVFMRSSRSSMGVAGDSIVAMFTAAGDLVNASAGTYLHAIIPPIVIKYVLKKYQENPGIEDGDIFYTNDALYGGIHNPDQTAIMPVTAMGWGCCRSGTARTCRLLTSLRRLDVMVPVNIWLQYLRNLQYFTEPDMALQAMGDAFR
jgi:acetophenone carboxylase